MLSPAPAAVDADLGQLFFPPHLLTPHHGPPHLPGAAAGAVGPPGHPRRGPRRRGQSCDQCSGVRVSDGCGELLVTWVGGSGLGTTRASLVPSPPPTAPGLPGAAVAPHMLTLPLSISSQAPHGEASHLLSQHQPHHHHIPRPSGSSLQHRPSCQPRLPAGMRPSASAGMHGSGSIHPTWVWMSIPPSSGELSTPCREKLQGQSDALSIKDVVPTSASPCLQKPTGSSSFVPLSFVFPPAPLTPPARVPPLEGRDLLLPGPQVPPGELAMHIFKIAVARETYAFGTRHHRRAGGGPRFCS